MRPLTSVFLLVGWIEIFIKYQDSIYNYARAADHLGLVLKTWAQSRLSSPDPGLGVHRRLIAIVCARSAAPGKSFSHFNMYLDFSDYLILRSIEQAKNENYVTLVIQKTTEIYVLAEDYLFWSIDSKPTHLQPIVWTIATGLVLNIILSYSAISNCSTIRIDHKGAYYYMDNILSIRPSKLFCEPLGASKTLTY